MRAVGIQPERIVAGVGLILLGSTVGSSAAFGVVAIPLAGFNGPDAVLRGALIDLALVCLAAAQLILASFVLIGRHSQRALVVATGLTLTQAVSIAVVNQSLTITLLTFSVPAVCAVALVIGAYRRRRA